MSTAVKDIFNRQFYKKFGAEMNAILPGFDVSRFVEEIYRGGFKHLEFKQRIRRTTEVMHQFMPSEFADVEPILRLISARLFKKKYANGIELLFLPDYIEVYGIDDFDRAVKLFESMTKVVTCEFAVRPFILRYPDRMLDVMKGWSLHEDAHVRRLASEGSRPRLPWAMALPALKLNPEPIIPILSNLREDPSEMVRRSVANSLNDISRDNPEVLVALTAKWSGRSEWTDAVLRHGCRTLLRKAHPEIMRHYNLHAGGIAVESLIIHTPEIQTGGALRFSFAVRNDSSTAQLVRLSYGLYYLRKNNTLSRKVFFISQRLYKAGTAHPVERTQSFRIITTRQFYTGGHKLSVIVNGEEKAESNFLLRDIEEDPTV